MPDPARTDFLGETFETTYPEPSWIGRKIITAHSSGNTLFARPPLLKSCPLLGKWSTNYRVILSFSHPPNYLAAITFSFHLPGSFSQMYSTSFYLNTSQPYHFFHLLPYSAPHLQSTTARAICFPHPSLPSCPPSSRLQTSLFPGTAFDKFTNGLHATESSGQVSALILTSQQPQTQLVCGYHNLLVSLWTLWPPLGLHGSSYPSPG